jgi:cyanophycinase
VDGHRLVIAAAETSEELDLVDVRAGLALVPFAVDVHASQWGTLTRLLHTVDQGCAAEGWAIDEDTMIQVDTNGIQVHGLGHAYRVQRASTGSLDIAIFRSGAQIDQR